MFGSRKKTEANIAEVVKACPVKKLVSKYGGQITCGICIGQGECLSEQQSYLEKGHRNGETAWLAYFQNDVAERYVRGGVRDANIFPPKNDSEKRIPQGSREGNKKLHLVNNNTKKKGRER